MLDLIDIERNHVCRLELNGRLYYIHIRLTFYIKYMEHSQKYFIFYIHIKLYYSVRKCIIVYDIEDSTRFIYTMIEAENSSKSWTE